MAEFKKSAWVWPLKSSDGRNYITDGYGWRNCPNHGWEFHQAVDIGTVYKKLPVYAAKEGSITINPYSAEYGYNITIKHPNGWYTNYNHLSKIEAPAGQCKAGDKIGYVGETGSATGIHLDFRMYTGSPQRSNQGKKNSVNPLKYVNQSDTIDKYDASTISTVVRYNVTDTSGDRDAKVPTYSEEKQDWSYVGASAGSGYGSGSDSTTSDSNLGFSASGDTEISIQRTPQQTALYTEYEDDTKSKGVDRYSVVWKKWNGDVAYDITSKVGNLQLKDDYNSICVECAFDLAGSIDDYYMPVINMETGDMITVSNTATAECIYVGQVNKMSGTTKGQMQVTAYDHGRALAYNKIITQFQNATAKEAISVIAGKCGLTSVSCPDFTGTIISTDKDNANTILKNILTTMTDDTGVEYFARVVGSCLVVKSFSKTQLHPYHRQASNLQAVPCTAEMTVPTISRDSTAIRNSVAVYSEEDSTISVKWRGTDDSLIERYGKRNDLVTYKADNQLTAEQTGKAYLTTVGKGSKDTLTVTMLGSDRIIAGTMIAIQTRGVWYRGWVESVTHNLSDVHTVSVTLRTTGGEEL